MRRLIWVMIFVIAAGMLAGLWVLLNPSLQQDAVTRMTEQSAATEVTWVVDAQGKVDGPNVLALQQGQILRMQITSAYNEELHVHGYEVLEKLPAGETVVLDVFLVHSGRFEVELHKRHRQLTVLEVAPK